MKDRKLIENYGPFMALAKTEGKKAEIGEIERRNKRLPCPNTNAVHVEQAT